MNKETYEKIQDRLRNKLYTGQISNKEGEYNRGILAAKSIVKEIYESTSSDHYSKPIPAYYEINVSKDGMHLFATHRRSITMMSDLKIVAEELKKRFPREQGFSIMITAKYEYGEFLEGGPK